MDFVWQRIVHLIFQKLCNVIPQFLWILCQTKPVLYFSCSLLLQCPVHLLYDHADIIFI